MQATKADHAVFVIRPGYIGFAFGDRSGSDPTLGKQPGQVLRKRWAYLRAHYPYLKTFEILR